MNKRAVLGGVDLELIHAFKISLIKPINVDEFYDALQTIEKDEILIAPVRARMGKYYHTLTEYYKSLPSERVEIILENI